MYHLLLLFYHLVISFHLYIDNSNENVVGIEVQQVGFGDFIEDEIYNWIYSDGVRRLSA